MSLGDRYVLTAGRMQLTGIQALARLPIDQHRRDTTAGHRTATFISGYEGSPLAGYDLELNRIRELLEANDVTFKPGLNEEAAATAVQGSQLANTLDGANHDGVMGMWYGKAPGLDRASDAIRHGNLMGAHPTGGALVVVGDDPAAKSSSVPCSSEFTFADLAIPFLYPADSQDVLDLGLHAVELSRASGLWVGLKIVTAVADGSSTVDLSMLDQHDGLPALPPGAKNHVPTARLLQPTLGPLERDLLTTRLRIAREYAAMNGLNRIVGRGGEDRIGIVAGGRTWQDLLATLRKLGIGPADLGASPVRLLKIGMPWPLEPNVVTDFASGLDEVLVLEEKRPFIEAAFRDILYGVAGAPRITGKSDPDGRDLVPSWGELDVDVLAPRVHRRLSAHGLALHDPDREPSSPGGRTLLPMAADTKRAPYFCSGCPHNSSTKPSGDSLVGGGIGCHSMVLLMDEAQVGTVTGLTQMGGEGLQWVGMSPFLDRDHFVQNLGDGTFDHSGSLAIRAAVASGVNMTYRLLYNSAVAMTGGQQAVSGMSLERIVQVLRAEGVARIIVTTEDLKRYRRTKLPSDVVVWHRDRIEEAQRELAATAGVTVLVHDQECATEKRRKRKRGLLETPQTRVFINERICEGCGDCGRKSNCLSVQPVGTELGRKTQIHQSSCNVDYSCLKGDCPAFMTVTPGRQSAKRSTLPALAPDDVPPPSPAVPTTGFGVRLTGVGGTGVVTVSQVLTTAGLLAGWTARSLDQTGLAQKGGAVVSDVRFHRTETGDSNKLSQGECDLYLGCDVLVAADPVHLAVASADRTIAVVNTAQVPTGRMVSDVSQDFPDIDGLVATIAERARAGGEFFDAEETVLALFDNDQFTNIFMVGVGFQKGAIPLPSTAIEEAIRLNGVAVEKNLQAFRRGRQYVADPAALRAAVEASGGDATGPLDRWAALPGESELDRIVRTRSEDLVAYQSPRYANRYRVAIEAVRAKEEAVLAGSTALAEAAARYLHKLMAYKDEYEVARLALDPAIDAELASRFGEGATASWHLHPPALKAMGMDRKLRLGPWFRPAFTVLRGMRRVRGTRWDVFGRAQVRVVERELILDYLNLLQRFTEDLTPDSHSTAVALAELPDVVRGYEDLKLDNVAHYRETQAALLQQFDAALTRGA
ncbi:indolepyruvate ferredoxin oxidoreductase family protein [Amycolatopsis sp. RM579]|uniref:Indolepyruvate ferredoxin oxidoreductase family protein n=2 Tax=Amycolatopsis pithecellobii TaxID=664692 RepID=A0A6N7ZBY3_9PSEU|nr:indolepyruvate ferredoxin oxidoreductase family protein [Amycolatopsis pithecellobii]